VEDRAERHAVMRKSVLNEFWLSAHEAMRLQKRMKRVKNKKEEE
jgi:hypothetical protein